MDEGTIWMLGRAVLVNRQSALEQTKFNLSRAAARGRGGVRPTVCRAWEHSGNNGREGFTFWKIHSRQQQVQSLFIIRPCYDAAMCTTSLLTRRKCWAATCWISTRLAIVLCKATFLSYTLQVSRFISKHLVGFPGAKQPVQLFTSVHVTNFGCWPTHVTDLPTC